MTTLSRRNFIYFEVAIWLVLCYNSYCPLARRPLVALRQIFNLPLLPKKWCSVNNGFILCVAFSLGNGPGRGKGPARHQTLNVARVRLLGVHCLEWALGDFAEYSLVEFATVSPMDTFPVAV